jgi:phage shock protein A
LPDEFDPIITKISEMEDKIKMLNNETSSFQNNLGKINSKIEELMEIKKKYNDEINK